MPFGFGLGHRRKPGGAYTPTPSPVLILSGPVVHNEGNSGTVDYVYTLTLYRDGSTASYPFSWAVTGTGTNPANAADFGGTLPSGSGTFTSGQTSKTITVTASGDTTVEADETFLLTVTAAGLNSPTALGTITNDDTGGGAPAIDAPILANLTSGWASGQNPPLWQSTYPNVQGYNSFSGAGDQVRAHWRLGAGAWTATAWEPLDDELATGDAPAWPFLTDGSLAAGGAFQVWEEIVRDRGLGTEQFSAASNIWADTIAAAAAAPITWDPAAKSTNFTLSNSNKTATVPVDPGGDCMVIGTLGKTTGKWYFEVAATVGGAFHALGVGIANSLPADYTIPGSTSSTAITYHGNGLVYRNSGNDGAANQAEWDQSAATKIIGVAFDVDAKKVWFALTNTYSGNPAAGTGGHAPTGISTFYPLYMARTPGEPGTLRTLTADMTYSPPAGFTALGGA